jgi:hypothetical protein
MKNERAKPRQIEPHRLSNRSNSKTVVAVASSNDGIYGNDGGTRRVSFITAEAAEMHSPDHIT